MTIPTPTSEGLAALSGAPSGAFPAGLPDEDTLARLAGELFAALPGGFGGAPAPRTPAPEIRLDEAGPQLAAAAPVAPVQAESVPLDRAPGAGKAGNPALGVP